MMRTFAALFCVALLMPAESRAECEMIAQQPTGAETRATDQEPLVVTIMGPDFETATLPITFQGKQPKDWQQLRSWLRGLANPELYPDLSLPVIGTLKGTDLRPSRRALLIRCHQEAQAGWVQAMLQLVTILPGRGMKKELENSPLMHRITFEVLGSGRQMPFPLPTDKNLDPEGPPPRLRITLRVPRSDWQKPPTVRMVQVSLDGIPGHKAKLGMIKGIASHSARPGRYSLQFEPPTLMLDLIRHIAAARQDEPRTTVSINAFPQAPFGALFDVAEACREAGFGTILLSGIPPNLVKQLARMSRPTTPETEQVEESPESREVAPKPNPRIRELGRTRRNPGTAVREGLGWLARTQAPDGHWDAQAHGGLRIHDVGVTALSLVAFLGQGSTPRRGSHKDVVRGGLKWLQSVQDAEGCFGSRANPSYNYGHALATLAMCEAYGMTRSDIWRSTAQKAVDFILKSQNPYKAWRYGVRPGDNDMSVSSWMILALKSAKMAELDVEPQSLKWALDFIEEMTDPETGRTGYAKRGELPVRIAGKSQDHPAVNSESLTAAAILCRVFCGQDPRKNPMIGKGVELIMKRLPRWEKGHVDMIYWYFGSLSIFQVAGPTWIAWNFRMKKAILGQQKTAGDLKGSWDPDGPWGSAGGRVYSTALMTMCLEVYYRYARVSGTSK